MSAQVSATRDFLVRLKESLVLLGLQLSAVQQAQLLSYMDMILKWNKVYNLTAIRNLEEVFTHHLLDSLAAVAPLQKHLLLTQATHPRVLDVGAGAGLPGAVIAICCPEISVTCVDTVGKKAAFIRQTGMALGLKNLIGLHARVEAMLPIDVRRGFDVITSRAFASLSDFINLTHKHLAYPDGVWMAMKAKVTDAYSLASPSVAAVFHVEPLAVPDLHEDRCLVWMRPPVA
jgi:16S rRNA (guanine527-N7)-methyltransferase